ncbi:MAG TPA: hypothetical protein VJX30_20510 [Terriglobales bacterium]|nr:hypothetical protein [Terriglobales bacterium]
MRRFAVVTLMLLIGAGPSFAKMRKDLYSVPCSVLWPTVKDTVRNSGNYAILMIDETEMIASFAIGMGQSIRIDSAVLNAQGDTCELRVQPLYEGTPFSDDGGDFKKRVDKALTQLQPSQPPAPAKPENPNR